MVFRTHWAHLHLRQVLVISHGRFLLLTGEGREEEKNKGKEGKKKKENREKEKQPPNPTGTPHSEEQTTRQGLLDKSASKAIAVHTAKPVIDGGGDGSGP